MAELRFWPFHFLVGDHRLDSNFKEAGHRDGKEWAIPVTGHGPNRPDPSLGGAHAATAAFLNAFVSPMTCIHLSEPPSVIRIDVDYRLEEVRAMAIEGALCDLERQGLDARMPWNWPIVQKWILAVVVPPIFWIRRIRVGPCVFEFDESGFKRISRGKTAVHLWHQVAEVLEMSTGLLIELREGAALPIPHRVLSVAQRKALVGYAHSRCNDER